MKYNYICSVFIFIYIFLLYVYVYTLAYLCFDSLRAVALRMAPLLTQAELENSLAMPYRDASLASRTSGPEEAKILAFARP